MKTRNFLTVLIGILISSAIIFYSCEEEEDTSTSPDTSSEQKAPVAAFIADKTSITAGSSVDFTDQSENSPSSWSWNFGDGNTSTKQNPTHTYNSEGTYTVSLTATNDADSDTETKTDYITVNSSGTSGNANIEMVTVNGGTFDMGCTSKQNICHSDENPVHTVTVDGFKISKYEITNQQYADFMNAIGASSDGSYSGTEYLDMDDGDCQIEYSGGQFVPVSGKGNYPGLEVTWHGAKAFCQHYGGRLPTEAEWEFAARGGNSANATLYAGSDNIGDVAWYSGNASGTPHEVGTKSPNELGIYDMSGNVWEWCSDWYGSDYYSSSPQNNPQGPSSGSYRVLRGGGWGGSAEYCRVADRLYDDPGNCYADYGFRFSQDQ
jgi:formylglycine-generating enzyme required for sulfatase activity